MILYATLLIDTTIFHQPLACINAFAPAIGISYRDFGNKKMLSLQVWFCQIFVKKAVRNS
jgi:hypothetical protein